MMQCESLESSVLRSHNQEVFVYVAHPSPCHLGANSSGHYTFTELPHQTNGIGHDIIPKYLRPHVTQNLTALLTHSLPSLQ